MRFQSDVFVLAIDTNLLFITTFLKSRCVRQSASVTQCYVLATMSVRSPRELFIYLYVKIRQQDQSIQKNSSFDFEKKITCVTIWYHRWIAWNTALCKTKNPLDYNVKYPEKIEEY